MLKLINDYTNDIARLCRELDTDSLNKAYQVLLGAYQKKKQIFVAGNGGSTGTANHFTCDFGKNAVKGDINRPKIISLSANTEVITALGNDFCYAEIFSQQLKNLMQDGDVIVLISASGNSANIISAAEYVRSRHGIVIGMTGFEGGRLKELSDVCINIPSDSYEKIEDIHMILTHILVCCFKSLNLQGESSCR